MGTEALWIPLAAAAIGGGVSYYNGQQLANKQDAQLAHGIQQQRARQGQVDEQTQALLSKFASSNPTADQDRARTQYRMQLGKNKGVANAGLTPVAGASKEYGTATQDAALGIADYGSMLSDLMARVDAPESQRRREGNMLADYGVNLDRVKRASAGDEFVNNMRLKSLHRNPWLDALAAAVKGAGSAYGSGFGGGDDLYTIGDLLEGT